MFYLLNFFTYCTESSLLCLHFTQQFLDSGLLKKKGDTIWSTTLTKHYEPTTNQSLLSKNAYERQTMNKTICFVVIICYYNTDKRTKHLQTNLCYTHFKGSGDKMAKDQRKICNKGLHNLYSSPIILLWWWREGECDGKEM
jgi:hypothetical protein